MNIADCTDNTWASAFQETGEKVLNIGAQDLGRYRTESFKWLEIAGNLYPITTKIVGV